MPIYTFGAKQLRHGANDLGRGVKRFGAKQPWGENDLYPFIQMKMSLLDNIQ